MVWDKPARPATITTDSRTKPTAGGVLIWDFPTRLFHWLLALCFCGSWITAEAGFDWTEVHFLFGYTTLGLVLFRICWGFLGNEYARFSQFLKSPAHTLRTLPQFFDAEAERSAGHSPYGGYAVLLLLYFALAQAISGLFISDDILYSGPYNPVVSNDMAGTLAWYHHLNFTLMQVMIGLHLLAIIWYRLRKKESLVLPMFHGRKSAPFPAATPVSPIKAILVIMVCAAIIVALVQLAPEPSLDYF